MCWLKGDVHLLTRLDEDFDSGHETADFGEVARRDQIRVQCERRRVVECLHVLDHCVQSLDHVWRQLEKNQFFIRTLSSKVLQKEKFEHLLNKFIYFY